MNRSRLRLVVITYSAGLTKLWKERMYKEKKRAESSISQGPLANGRNRYEDLYNKAI